MRGEENDPGLSHSRKKLKDRALSLRIETCYRLIQDHHRGILIDEPGQRQALPLSAGQINLSTKPIDAAGIQVPRQRTRVRRSSVSTGAETRAQMAIGASAAHLDMVVIRSAQRLDTKVHGGSVLGLIRWRC